jgi:WD40 repeat protein
MTDPGAFAPATASAARAPSRLIVEQRRRWEAGERVPVEVFLDAYPALRTDTDALLDLVYNEVVLRRQCGEEPPLEEYTRRFPELTAPLRLQLEFSRALARDDTAIAVPPAAAAMPPGYEALSEVGRGGMGVVYKARHRALDRVVALKRILAGACAGARERAQFLAEARAAARLQHPNIVQIHEVGEDKGQPYLVLEFVDGPNLRERIGGRPGPALPAARLVLELVRAMHYAHQRGVVHSDLKPANVLLAFSREQSASAPEGALREPSRLDEYSAKITDFGLARRLDAGAGQTQTGLLVGTPSYMAPEQADGGQVGPRADVYGLGAILYELLTGRPPFLAETALETLAQVRAQEPVPPSRLRPGLSRDLETICLKCLEKEPARRYASADALGDDLGRFLASRPVAARRAGRVERAWRWCRRNPAVAALAGSLAALLVAAAAGGTGAAVLLAERRAEAVGQREEAKQARQQAVENLREALVAQAEKARGSTAPGRRFDSLEALRKAAAVRPSAELRDLTIECLTLADLRPAAPGMRGDEPPPGAAEHYACAAAGGDLRVYRFADAAELLRLRGPAPPAWVWESSPDGRLLAAKYHLDGRERPNELWVWDLGRGEPIRKIPTGACEHAFGFSGDGGVLAVGDHEGGVTLHDLAADGPTRRLGRGPAPRCLAFRPGGRELVVADRQTGRVQAWDAAAGRPLWAHDFPAPVLCLAWHPGGRLLAAGCRDFNVYVWDAAFGRAPVVLPGHEAELTHLAFNHGGDLLLSISWERLCLWDPWTGRQLVDTPAKQDRARFSRDDRWLRYAAREGPQSGWEVSAGRECRTLHGHTGYKGPWGLDIDPDGRLLASAGSDGVRLWDLASAREVAFLPLPGAHSAIFVPGGDGLITCGASGVQRWPMTPGPDGPADGLRVGPPQALAVLAPAVRNRAYLGADGHTLAVTDHARGQVVVLDLGDLSSKTLPEGHASAAQVAVSPDGRWVASGTYGATGGVRVWDLRAGTPPGGLPASNSYLSFSPDGRWLAKSGDDGCVLLKVGSWEEVRRVAPPTGFPAPVAFAPDGKMLAVAADSRKVRLLDPETGEPFATLADSRSGIITWLSFSRDGVRLAVAAENHLVRVWDLRLIRRQLAAIDLDWDLPPYPPAPDRGTAPPRVTVLTGAGLAPSRQ